MGLLRRIKWFFQFRCHQCGAILIEWRGSCCCPICELELDKTGCYSGMPVVKKALADRKKFKTEEVRAKS